MKKNIISAAILLTAAVAATSCAKEIQSNNPIPGGNGTFTGVIEQFGDATKTVLTSDHKVVWESTDIIRINDGVFSVAPNESDATKADFTFVSGTEPATGPYTAYYPSTLYDGSKLTLPETQTCQAGKITNNPMYATSESSSLKFHNLCGLVEFTFKGTATISKIIVTANEGGLSGEFTVVDNKAVLTDDAKAANKGVTLDCGTGVTLNEADGVKFWIAIPAGTYTLTFTAIDSDGKIFQQITKAGVAVTANNIYAFTQTPEFTGSGYLCFTALEAGATVTLNKKSSPTGNSLEYSTDQSSWSSTVLPDDPNTSVDIATIANAGDKIYIRAKEARTTAQTDSKYIYFSADKNVEVSGNIMYLVDPTGAATTISRDHEFCRLFDACEKLIHADKLVLPATTLADYCYYNMFSGCSGLTTAPELKATTLAEACYTGMFYGCTGLTTAPELPATTLTYFCYSNMFGGCTKLSTAPELKATTLAEACYTGMFSGCTGLTTAPELQAMTLAQSCYKQMFSGCTGLTTAPELPATTLEGASGCYWGMFAKSGLTTAPALPATTLASSCYQAMFSGCTGLTTAPALSATTLADNCYLEMFSGCTGLTTAPALPATTLASSCYQAMFSGCTGLTTAPALPATTLASSCYYAMFSGCTGLTTASALPATTLTNSCYAYMFNNCIALTEVPAVLPATTLANSCYVSMFGGCTGLTTAPTLPSLYLCSNSYDFMFFGCTSLESITCLATDISATDCTKNWVKGVSSLGTFTKASGMTSWTTGESGIPTGWTAIDVIPGAFSVSATKKVYFSAGNLQYQASTSTWRFAESQYSIIGDASGNTTAVADRATQAGWIDLFGWAATGMTSINANLTVPYNTDRISSEYKTTASVDASETLTRTNGGDWGVCMGAGFYTLSNVEWDYVFNTRSETYRYAKALLKSVGNITGMILFPDGFSLPEGVTVNSVNTATASYTSNRYDSTEWGKLETAGCVFLPAAGYRNSTSVNLVGSSGNYWSSPAHPTTSYARKLFFDDSHVYPADAEYRYNGLSVRLVTE